MEKVITAGMANMDNMDNMGNMARRKADIREAIKDFYEPKQKTQATEP